MEDKIAKCALYHYEKALPGAKGKPNENEWTVYAVIVAAEENADPSSSRYWVVSCATGTKCSSFTPPMGISKDETGKFKTTILPDCHAEVLARRGLMYSLFQEIQQDVSNRENFEQYQNRLLEVYHTNEEGENASPSSIPYKYKLREGVSIHLYISDSPCGDASIYPVITSTADDRQNAEDNKHSKTELNFTGAKVIVSKETGVEATACGGNHQLLVQTSSSANDDSIVVAREDIQLLGKLRTKSGRSNLPAHLRSSCMSCSDKLVRWSVLGLQGTLLSRYIPIPIRLSSIVVSQDPRAVSLLEQKEALSRATQRRVASVMNHIKQHSESLLKGNPEWNVEEDIPTVHIVKPTFPRSKSMSDYHYQTNGNASGGAEGDGRVASSSATGGDISRKRKRQEPTSQGNCTKFSPCGVSLNWIQQPPTTTSISPKNPGDGIVELVIGARGIRQGKKPKTLADYQRLASRLCRHQFQCIVKTFEKTESDQQYSELKNSLCDPVLKSLRSTIFSGGPLAGWLTSSSL